MKILPALRRRVFLRGPEKEGLEFLTNVIACQIGGLIIQQGVNLFRMKALIPSNKVVRAYFLGLAWYANDNYKLDDFEWVLYQVGVTLNEVLHSRNPNLMEVLKSSFNPDYRDVLVASWNSDRKQIDDEFKSGWEMARSDLALYLTESKSEFERQHQIKMDEMGSLTKALAPKFSLFQFVKHL